MKFNTKSLQRPKLRRTLLTMLFSCFSLFAWAQPDFTIQAADPNSGLPNFEVLANPADTDLSHYDFMWVFENGYHEFGPSVNYGFQSTNNLNDVVEVELYASKRYDVDDDPHERIAANINIAELVNGGQSARLQLSRDPRSEFESLFQFTMGYKYPFMVVVTLHPSFTFNDIAGGGTDCIRQYESFEPEAGNYQLEEKEHAGVDVPNKKLFYVSQLNNPFLGPNRADLILPLCTEQGIEMDEELSVQIQVYELRNQTVIASIDSLKSLDQLFQEMGDLWNNSAPIYENTLNRLAVSSWDPNAKSARGETDSTVCKSGTITYQIQYENVGSAVEPRVLVFDTLPDYLDPAIFDIEFDRPLTDVDDDANPHTLQWQADQLFPGESGKVTFKAKVKPTVPVGTVIENDAVIRFVFAGQDSTTNMTRIAVTDCTERVDVGDRECNKCCPETDCPKNWRWWLALMFLLALLFFILWIRALRRP